MPDGHSNKVFFIPHYVDFELDPSISRPLDRFIVIYHGRLREEEKATSEILKVAHRVRLSGGVATFRLIGENYEADLYKNLVREYGLEKSVEFSDPLSWDQLQKELAQSHVAILSSRFEGFCYSAAEAMSAGLPVLAYDCGEVINDYVVDGESGFVVDWGDADALAAHVLRLQCHFDEWTQLSRGAIEKSRKLFGFDEACQRYRTAMEWGANVPIRWPRVRPAHIPVSGKSFRSFFEKVGLRLGYWQK